MTTDDKLDKIIDLLVSQNNLLTSIMISLQSQTKSEYKANAAPPQINNIRAEIESKIEAARREAHTRLNQIQASVPEINTLLKTE